MREDFCIEFDDVVQQFRRIKERPDTLREVFAKIRHYRASYQNFEALKHISFCVSKGEMVGVIGRNGSGKSTILKLAAGVYRPTSGRVVVNGTIAPLIELGAGFHHELTGRENILLNGLLLGLTKKQVKEKEGRIIDFAELGDFIDSPVKQYSSGMYMRLAFSVAVEVDPDILVIDEILSVGDLGFREKCFHRILGFKAAGRTIFLVTHDTATIQQYCDRALLIHNGLLVADGAPDMVVDRYAQILGTRTPAPPVAPVVTR
jgi:ABC-type polysaccharide/polyol phosphate transport system ATPase subunit